MRVRAGLLAAMVLASGCSALGDKSPTPSISASPPAIAQAIIKGTLNTHQYAFAPEWIPVQKAPQLEEGESLTPENTWPKDGDEVDVVCETTGGPYPSMADPSKLAYAWYQIKLPNSTRTGYVEALWVQLPSKARSCNGGGTKL